jgi:hypothetical protein
LRDGVKKDRGIGRIEKGEVEGLGSRKDNENYVGTGKQLCKKSSSKRKQLEEKDEPRRTREGEERREKKMAGENPCSTWF